MIAVICAECGEAFEIGDEFAGLTEFCPGCGALNEIPDPGTPAEDEPLAEVFIPASAESAAVNRGIPAGLWWSILITALGLFVLGCVYLLSDNWEARNIQALSDAANRGDVLMGDEDYAGAAREYRVVLDTVGNRAIESAFILKLIDRARRGEVDAENRLRAPRQVAQSQPAPATEPDTDFHVAIRSFQRDYEAFPAFVRDHPIFFQDIKGNWRRRQYFVWEDTFDSPAESDHPKIILRYSCASHITEPHGDRHDAALDDVFAEDESPREVHCQTQFEWFSGSWVILHQDAGAQPEAAPSADARPSLDDFYSLERVAFHAAVPPR